MTVGLQQSYYMTVEGEGPVEICLGLLSGDITGSTFIIDYNTINGLAEGQTAFEPPFVMYNTAAFDFPHSSIGLCDAKWISYNIRGTNFRLPVDIYCG